VDLERLFRQIVVNLAATDPARLRAPLILADIRHSIVPYRANRRTLQIESSEDYELALMRLCAGEEGLAHTEGGEIQEEFASELRSPNPDLAILERHEKTAVTLDPAAVAKVLDVKPDLKFAPSQSNISHSQPERAEPTKSGPDPSRVQSPPTQCNRCSGTLPVGRVVNFCPQCGQNLTRRQCPQCNTELEPSWKHCVSCGVSLSRPQH
jgi:hypothetical protein